MSGPGGEGREWVLGGVEGEETLVRRYFVRENLF